MDYPFFSVFNHNAFVSFGRNLPGNRVGCSFVVFVGRKFLDSSIDWLQGKRDTHFAFACFDKPTHLVSRKTVEFADAGVRPRVASIENADVVAAIEDKVARLSGDLVVVGRERLPNIAHFLEVAVVVCNVNDIFGLQSGNQGSCSDIVFHCDGVRLLADGDIHFLFHSLCKSLAVFCATYYQYCSQ